MALHAIDFDAEHSIFTCFTKTLIMIHDREASIWGLVDVCLITNKWGEFSP